jgi:predicted DCC family thiol-disulfide oxidoreductase YuxK
MSRSSGFVQFVMERDSKQQLHFASLQSDVAQVLLAQNEITNDLSSVVLIHKGKVHVKSSAVLQLASLLDMPW